MMPEEAKLIALVGADVRLFLALWDMILLAHFRAQVSIAPRTPPRRVARLPFPEALKTYFVDPQFAFDMS